MGTSGITRRFGGVSVGKSSTGDAGCASGGGCASSAMPMRMMIIVIAVGASRRVFLFLFMMFTLKYYVSTGF